MTEKQFLCLEYTEYEFRARFLREKRRQAERDSLTAASFTAWQMLCAQGLKTPWSKYISDLLPENKTEEQTASCNEADLKAAREIHRLLYHLDE